MAAGIVNEQYTRGGKTKTLKLGVDVDGTSHYKAETVLPEPPYDLPVRESAVEINIKLDRQQLTGALSEIKISVGRGFVSPNGQVIENTIVIKNFLSKEQDKKDFALMYGNGILRSVANGIIEILDGFDGQKLFDPATGATLPDPAP